MNKYGTSTHPLLKRTTGQQVSAGHPACVKPACSKRTTKPRDPFTNRCSPGAVTRRLRSSITCQHTTIRNSRTAGAHSITIMSHSITIVSTTITESIQATLRSRDVRKRHTVHGQVYLAHHTNIYVLCVLCVLDTISP